MYSLSANVVHARHDANSLVSVVAPCVGKIIKNDLNVFEEEKTTKRYITLYK